MTDTPSFRSNLMYALVSNFSIAAVSGLSTLVVPKIIGVEEYGYWQLFVFYGTYALLLQLGAGDGANLRYGGLQSTQLRAKAVGMQAVYVAIGTSCVSVLLIFVAPVFVHDSRRLVVVQLAGVFACVVNCRHYLAVLLQAVAEFRNFSRVSVLDRLAFSGAVSLLLFAGVRDYTALVSVEVVSKILSLALAVYLGRSFLVVSLSQWRLAFSEMIANVAVGLKLTIGNTANLLVLGIARFLIDRVFGVAVFGAMSLVLNLASLLMIFVNAVGFVLFPALRRMSVKRLPELYDLIRGPLAVIPFLVLIFAYPVSVLVEAWLPAYAVAVQFIPILMVMIVFEAKMGLLVIPYMKAIRGESQLLVANLIAMLSSLVLSVICTVLLEDLGLAVGAIIVALGVRAVITEVMLLRRLGIRLSVSFWVELALICAYLLLHSVVGQWGATVGFASLCIAVALLGRRWLSRTVRQVLSVMRRA